MHKRYGTFVRIAPNHISIADPAALEVVYGHSSRLLKSDFYDVFYTEEADMFSTRDRSIHAVKRKRVAHIFSPQSVLAFQPRIQQHIQKLCQQWDYRCNAAARGTSGENWIAMDGRAVFDSVAQFGYLSFDVIGDLALGSSFGMIESQRDATPLKNHANNRTTDVPVVQLTQAVAELATVVGAWPAWIRPLVRLLPWNYARYKALVDFMHLTVAKVEDKLDRMKKEVEKAEDSSPMVDIIDKLLELREEHGAGLSRREIISEAFLFLFAGGDTTSTTMGAFCYFLAANREAQLKLQAELDENIPLDLDFNGDDATATPIAVASHEHVKDLSYLNACLKEVMRLQSIVGVGLPRIVPPGQTFTFKGETFKEGSVISVPAMTINHMDIWGPDAKMFRPERWLEPEAQEFQKYYLPFSLGVRACLGRNLAIMQLLIVAATLFHRYDVMLSPSQSGKEIQIHEAMQRKVEHCDVGIKLRKGGSN
ncbi:hypothetical protein FRC11_011955 [Ceratobasidium sp. 423]|nr:hypothetical protein FRC11_011955 [Ceratobasidium sp. 423]